MEPDDSRKIHRSALVLIRQFFRLGQQIRMTSRSAENHRSDTCIQLRRNQKAADPLRAFEPLMPGKSQKIDVCLLHVNGKCPRTLSRIHRKKDIMPFADLPDLFNRKHRSAHIGSMQHKHQPCLRTDLLLHGLSCHLAL